jgi:CHAD domain-containing protein
MPPSTTSPAWFLAPTRNCNNGKTSVATEALEPESFQRIGPDAPAAAAVRLALTNGLQRLRENDLAARRGDAEGVHRMRTAARRLRSELTLYRDLFDGVWSEPLQQDLQWLGHCLGAVRDEDVLRGRLREAAGELLEDLGPLFEALAQRHKAAAAELCATFESDRYHHLLDRLAEVCEHPCLGDRAGEPCARTLPALVRKRWKQLRRLGRALDLSVSDEQYHLVRKRAKRARYSAESIAPALDSESASAARRFARQANRVQDVLGEHRDATIACREIGRIAAENPGTGPFVLAAGRLLERQAVAASKARTGFFKAWQRLDRKKNDRWMKV